MANHNGLIVEGLTRVFGKGSKAVHAVQDVNFSVPFGSIHALLGPNGAGKTTTVRMCSTLLKPTAGHAVIDGVDAVKHPEKARRSLGLVLGGDLGFYPRATAKDNLLFFADVAGVPWQRRKTEVDNVLTEMQLYEFRNRKAGAFSRGMKQRLHLARAMLGHPKVLLLDEPTTGLDPEVALSVREIILGLANTGCAILLTSHSMGEIEALAGSLSVIGNGRIVVAGQTSDVAQYAGVDNVLTMRLPAQAILMQEEMSALIGERGRIVFRAHGSNWDVNVYCENTSSPAAVLSEIKTFLDEAAISPIGEIAFKKATLEDAYLALAERLHG